MGESLRCACVTVNVCDGKICHRIELKVFLFFLATLSVKVNLHIVYALNAFIKFATAAVSVRILVRAKFELKYQWFW